MLTILLLAACQPTLSPDAPPAPATPEETACADAEARLGESLCVHRVPDDDVWRGISITALSAGQRRLTKHLVPARDDARLPPLFMDTHTYKLHLDLLVNAFPDDFAGLTGAAYNDLVLDPVHREFYAGTVHEYVDDGGPWYGFTLWDRVTDPSATVTAADALAAWKQLSDRFALGPLAFVPSTPNQIAAAAGWTNLPFEVRAPDSLLEYEPYTVTHGYGTLRRYTLPELADATEAVDFGYQDILVIDQAPSDLERVVAGVVTGTRQGELTHLAVRTSSRGTPNCYVRDAWARLAAWEGELVRLSCDASGYSVSPATLDEAEAWWASYRPAPVDLPDPDLDTRDLPLLRALPTATAAERARGVAAWGAKGTNLAVLYQRIDLRYQHSGFLIPFSAYAAFVETAGWEVDLGSGAGFHTFAETLSAWHEDPAFLSDGALRRERLSSLREAMKASGDAVDPALIGALTVRIREVWGGDDTMVRFRSSSNAEDALGFSGAGLYDSRSACLADELDGDEAGPSRCDARHGKERTLRDALTRVWASLWAPAAWEERDWYGMDHGRAAMGILVNDRLADELANAVAFTGNPTTSGDDRYLVNSQYGELDAVSSEPGVVPEKALLTVTGGAVTTILRVSSSSEVPPGAVVLTDAQLREVGGLLATIRDVFPVDGEIPAGQDLLLDTEWKVRADGQLIIKQVRPYLR